MTPYVPLKTDRPERVLSIPSHLAGTSWAGNESIIADLLDRFHVGRKSALEFGVEFGYSAVALSNFFDKVIGVDTFLGDEHSNFRPDYSEDARNLCAPYDNIKLVQSSWEDWTAKAPPKARYDLIHVDIVHNYQPTFDCGLWAVKHAPIVIFHDTLSFHDVMRACEDLAEQQKLNFYNYEYNFGLGILSAREPEPGESTASVEHGELSQREKRILQKVLGGQW